LSTSFLVSQTARACKSRPAAAERRVARLSAQGRDYSAAAAFSPVGGTSASGAAAGFFLAGAFFAGLGEAGAFCAASAAAWAFAASRSTLRGSIPDDQA